MKAIELFHQLGALFHDNPYAEDFEVRVLAASKNDMSLVDDKVTGVSVVQGAVVIEADS